jgi:(p)ppGpp synthase/HD superfamily hydrolase
MVSVELAARVAETVHDGQTRQDGSSYFGHCQRVASRVQALGPRTQAVAYLHDVIEDTALTYKALLALFGPEVASDVRMLSREEEETYEEYIARVAGSGSYAVLRVKLADLADNLMPAQGAASLRPRYLKADEVIRAALGTRFGETW